MQDLIVIAVVMVITGAASLYIYREKKNGVKCIGCPMGKSCARKAGGTACGCADR